MIDVVGTILLEGAPSVSIVDESESTPGMSRQITGFRRGCEPYLHRLLVDVTGCLNKKLPGADNSKAVYDDEIAKVVRDMDKFSRRANFVVKVFDYWVNDAGATLNMTFEPCDEDGAGN